METIKLNLIPSGVNPTCHAKQYDKGRTIRFELFNGLTPYTLQSGDTVTLNLRKPDNTIIESSVTATQGNNYVDLVTTEQMCAVAGYNLGTFKIVNGETDIGTLDFIMEVGKDVLANGIASQSVIEDLDALVAEAVGDDYYTKTEVDNALALKASASDVATLSDNVSALGVTVNGISEGGPSKNIYPTSYLSETTGITYENGVFTGSASSFNNATRLTNFEANKQYTAQITVRKKSGTFTASNGIFIRFNYDDSTYMSTYVPNDTENFTKFTLTSGEGKVVTEFKIAYASLGNDIWEVKEVQVEEGTEATPYVSPEASTLTAIDKVARAKVNALPWYSRFSKEFLKIAYSAIWVDKINTATHWLFAADMGFNTLKGDVEITSDGELIMCHDAGFTFDENGRIIAYDPNNKTLIVNMTYAECRSKFYADNPQRYGGYCPVADIDDFIRICKDKGKICFLTIRATNTAAVVAKAIEKIKYYGMESRTIINAVQSSIIDVVRANSDADGIAVNCVAPEGQAITTAQVDKCVDWGNAFLSIWADGSTTVIDNSAAAIAYAKTKQVPILAAVSGDMAFWNYLIEKGVWGYQITKPTFDVDVKNYRFTVSVSSGSVSFGNLFASNRFTGTVSLSGNKIYVSDVCITGSYLTNVIDGIQPIKMNMLNPDIKCIDSSGNIIPCIWNGTNNRFELSLSDTNDNTYRVIVNV